MKLTSDKVAKTHTGTPAHLAMYASDVTGPGAIARAVKMCVLYGRKVKLAVCVKEGAEAPNVVETVTLATVPGCMAVRYCGENDNPVGAGSHSAYGSTDVEGDPTTLDLAEVTAAVTWYVAKSGNCVFLLA